MARPARDDRPIISWDSNGALRVNKKHPAFLELVENGLPEDYIERCLYDEDCLVWFCRYFLQESFKKPFTDQRLDFARNISDPDKAKVWGIASRGFGKSALVVAELVRGICFRLYPFIVYSSSELSLAETRTNQIKSTIVGNHRIRLFFGNMTPKFVDGRREAFGTQSYTLTDPYSNVPFCVVVPKSEGTTVNGLLENINGVFTRPTLLVSDDGEDRERVHDEAYREKHHAWFFDTFMPCVDTDYEPTDNRWDVKRGHSAPWLVRLFDTSKAEGALIESAAQDPDWDGSRYPMAEEVRPNVFRSLNKKITDEQLQKKFESAKKRGGEGGFFREWLCLPRESSESTFPSTFQYYSEDDVKINEDRDLHRFIIVDPARTTSSLAACTAMLAVAVDVRRALIYLRRLVNDHLNVEEVVDTLMRLSKEMNTDILCVEDAGVNDWMKGPLQQGAQLRNIHPMWLWLPPGSNNIATSGNFGTGRTAIKRRRAASAIPYYRPFKTTHEHGHVLHENALKNSALEQQQHSYPNPRRWDALDCLGYVDYVMRQLGITFDFQPQTQEAGETVSERRTVIDMAHRSNRWRLAG